jgi:hypothetical protein
MVRAIMQNKMCRKLSSSSKQDAKCDLVSLHILSPDMFTSLKKLTVLVLMITLGLDILAFNFCKGLQSRKKEPKKIKIDQIVPHLCN